MFLTISPQKRRKLMATKEKTLLPRILKRNLVMDIFIFFTTHLASPFSDQSIWGEKVVTGPEGGQIPCKGGSILDTKETNAGGIQTKKDCK